MTIAVRAEDTLLQYTVEVLQRLDVNCTLQTDAYVQ